MNVAQLKEEKADKIVLDYLTRHEKQNPDLFKKLVIFSVAAKDLRKYLLTPELCKNWGDC
jgi:hypothetical protein